MNEIRLHEHTMTFGWDGDHGLGETLISRILTGKKTATCAPVQCYSKGGIEATVASIGRIVTVLDKYGTPRCNVRILDVFETPFGRPDPRLVSGEGYGADADAFQSAHRRAWRDEFRLEPDTRLLAELFELASD